MPILLNTGGVFESSHWKRKRDPVSIVHEILMLSRAGASVSCIARRSGMNFQRTAAYVALLLASGHLHTCFMDDQKLYVLSNKGQQLLGGLSTLKESLREVFPNRPPS